MSIQGIMESSDFIDSLAKCDNDELTDRLKIAFSALPMNERVTLATEILRKRYENMSRQNGAASGIPLVYRNSNMLMQPVIRDIMTDLGFPDRDMAQFYSLVKKAAEGDEDAKTKITSIFNNPPPQLVQILQPFYRQYIEDITRKEGGALTEKQSKEAKAEFLNQFVFPTLQTPTMLLPAEPKENATLNRQILNISKSEAMNGLLNAIEGAPIDPRITPAAASQIKSKMSNALSTPENADRNTCQYLRHQLLEHRSIIDFLKTTRIIQNLGNKSGIEGFKIVFEYYNQNDKSLKFVRPDDLRILLKNMMDRSAADPAFKDFIKTDPTALSFMNKANEILKPLKAKEDKTCLEFLEKSIKKSEASPEHIVKKLKELGGKLDKGIFKDKVASAVTQIESIPNFPRVTSETIEKMSTELTRLKLESVSEAMASKKADTVREIGQICDLYKRRATPSAATPSAATPLVPPPTTLPPPHLPPSTPLPDATSLLAAAAAAPQPQPIVMGYHSFTKAAAPLPHQAAPISEMTAKENLIEKLSDLAKILKKGGAGTVSELIDHSIETINRSKNDDEVEKEISHLISEVSNSTSTTAAASSSDIDSNRVIADIQQIHQEFQNVAKPPTPKAH